MTTWSDPQGRPVEAPEPPPAGSYYGPIGDWQGAAYERNAFTKGTEQEVAFLLEELSPAAGTHVVDVGCGTGRHSRALADRGLRVTGVDLSHGLLTAAAGHRKGCWVQADARALPLRSGSADVVLSLCQGGFGITPGGDQRVLAEMVRILRPGGRLVMTAFSLAFAARWLAPGDALDVGRGLHHAPADVRGPDGAQRRFDLWTACYSAAHLQLLAGAAGLTVEGIYGAEPGSYGRRDPSLSDPELLLVGRKA